MNDTAWQAMPKMVQTVVILASVSLEGEMHLHRQIDHQPERNTEEACEETANSVR
jgi:hypothetical protein